MKLIAPLSFIGAAMLLSSCDAKPLPEAKPPVQRERIAYLQKTAAQPVSCTSGADCSAKWALAHDWVLKHSVYSIKNDTNTEISTNGPLEPTTDAAFRITREPAESGNERITFWASCGDGAFCTPTILELASSFHNAVMFGK